jgi:transcription elongation factor GreA
VAEEIFYLTKEGLEKFKKEFKQLKKIKAMKIKGEVPDILHSEEANPEYLSFQEDIEFLEARISELENILKNFKLITPPEKEEQDKICLGATVLVEVDGRIDEFTLVGKLEANPSIGKISNESPVGRVLMGKKVGEEVLISSPIKVIYKIKKIRYEI